MRNMNLKTLICGTTLLAVAGVLLAQVPAVKPILPSALNWATPAALPDISGAWVIGAEKQSGPYLQRVRLKAGGRIPPHTHPDARYSTVLSGTLYVGFGEQAEDAAMTAVPTGAVYEVPANVPHYLWARDGEVLYQEAGYGPTATAMIGAPAR